MTFNPPPAYAQPQECEKKRLSIRRKAKQAYDYSQKNAWTKAATKVAKVVTVVAVGATIGADVSGVFDVFDMSDVDPGQDTGMDSSAFAGSPQTPPNFADTSLGQNMQFTNAQAFYEPLFSASSMNATV